ESDEIKPKIIPIDPSDRCSFNLNRHTTALKREAQPQIEAWLNRMVTLDTHPRLRQICHNTLSHTFSTEIIKNKPGRYASIGTEHKCSAFRFGEPRVWYCSHYDLRSQND